jgi:hypothetical protein
VVQAVQEQQARRIPHQGNSRFRNHHILHHLPHQAEDPTEVLQVEAVLVMVEEEGNNEKGNVFILL